MRDRVGGARFGQRGRIAVDVTAAHVEDARAAARAEGLRAELERASALDVRHREEFDVVLNLADAGFAQAGGGVRPAVIVSGCQG